MTDITFVYTVSSIGTMIQKVSVSIQSLRKQQPSSHILIFATPPVDESDLNHLRKLADDVRVCDHYLDPIPKYSGHKPRHYADMLHVCDVNAETVVFLDADTVVLDNPERLLGPGKIRARPDDGGMNDPDRLKEIADVTNVHDWVPNTGVVVFQDGVHRELADNWKQGIEVGAGQHPWTEQHGLAVAGGDYNWRQLSASDHTFAWNDEHPTDIVVFHFGDRWNNSLNLDNIRVPDFLKKWIKKFLR